ncbi:hypothetical protein [Parasitella parasitica]|uniref:Uncharacterized protein n=1 Tax=Parasitella parasitica TaxID=35722 RepID=A0A0B7NS66_9FUNG|nr:hypothetical protein [Parasitella parasitica]
MRGSGEELIDHITNMSGFQVVLREGIVQGGFAGPTFNQVVEINGDANGAMISQSTLKPESKNDYHTKSGATSSEDLSKDLEWLKEKLENLPTEKPTGSQDIYGLKTSLLFVSVCPEGCSEGSSEGGSEVQPSPDQKKSFKEVVDKIKNLGEQHALTVAA